MAIIKNKELSNGTSGEYWVAQPIADAHNKRTQVLMLLYASEEARDNGSTFIIRENVGFMSKYLPTGEEVYAFVKESKMVTTVEAEDAETDEEGNVVSEAIEQVQEESNWFNDGVDSL